MPPITETITKFLPQWLNQGQSLAPRGQLPQYIPQLAQVNPELIALGIAFKEESIIWGYQDPTKFFGSSIGDSRIITNDIHDHSVLPQFPLMSIIKPFLFLYVLQTFGLEQVLTLVNTNASDLPFNVIPTGKPPNPMLNCGAIALCSLLVNDGVNDHDQQNIHNGTCQGSHRFQNWLQQIIEQSATATSHVPINLLIDYEMLNSVRSVPLRRNLAIADTLEALGIITDGAAALAIYEEICCFTTNVIGLARLGQSLLNVAPLTELVLQVMTHCGMYSYSAEFTKNVGIPAKSAVSGAILGILPQRAAIAVYSPPLDAIGNSLAGLFLLSQVIEISALHNEV